MMSLFFFTVTQDGLTVLGFDAKKQGLVFSILAGVCSPSFCLSLIGVAITVCGWVVLCALDVIVS